MKLNKEQRAERTEKAIRALLGKRRLTQSQVMGRVYRMWWTGGTITALASGIGVYAFTARNWTLLLMCLGVDVAMSFALLMADTVVDLLGVLESAAETVSEAERVTRQVLDRMPKAERELILREVTDEREPVMPHSLRELFAGDRE